MKDNKILLLIAIIFVLVGGYFIFQKNITNSQELSLKVKFVKEETNLYKISAEYPQFDALSKSFNDQIQTFVSEQISEFKKNSDENNKLLQQNATPEELSKFPQQMYSLSITWSPEQLNNQYISFIMRVNAFEGGANQRQEIKTFNYDIVNKKEVELLDLFKNDPNYIQQISDFSINYLTEQFRNQPNCPYDSCVPKDMIASGAAPDADNFKNFTFNENFVTFYFPKAQVAPGADGEQKVIMPRE
ncbi:MAG: DUF3298 and DUF4163 domain-containing protein [Patescibacteria group bacterium]|nr:DUF3298 and DUF4163 domain-containing protein [Patescibacteria group bacterium]